ncbi:NAD(P)/FAD-dependent oxidoreductase [Prochlorothrix hollandica]|uniref:NAD(P)/FAD-dependent oxidoreductase n=1 Tax=Prochlorothrix hollandica TaxID=1223 RepID=UPI0033401C27
MQPQALTQALVEGATAQGGRWLMPVTVAAVVPLASGKVRVEWGTGSDLFDRVVISAGLDSSPLIPASPPLLLDPPLVLEPVLGQGARLRLPLQGTPLPQPVMTGHDIHLVPLGAGEYGLGATVEFAPGREPGGGWIADGAQWDELWRRAIDLWPLLAEAEVLETWAGARPRPVGRSAPVIEGLRGGAIVVATGHYRNGVLLAPATAARAIDLLALPPLGDRI